MEDQTVKNPDKGGVQSVARIFELIEVLAAHPAGASLQRLAEDAHLAKSTTHRLLGSLVSLGYAAQDGETGKYRLTLKMFEISSGIVNSMDVMSVAKVHLERLAQRTGEAVHLVIRDAQDIVYIYKTESGPMRMSSRVGLRSPLYCTGVGKAILATLTEEEVTDFCRGQIARYKVPKYIFFVNEYPMTASGKIQKYKLTQMSTSLLEAAGKEVI